MLKLLCHKSQLDLNEKNEIISSIISELETIKMANAIFTKFEPEQTFLNSVMKYKSTIDKDDVNDLVKRINTLKPDIVVFTGNLIGYNVKPTESDIEYLKEQLSKIAENLTKVESAAGTGSTVTDAQIEKLQDNFENLNKKFDSLLRYHAIKFDI